MEVEFCCFVDVAVRAIKAEEDRKEAERLRVSKAAKVH